MDVLENSVRSDGKKGSIELITGSMFSGKTEELIRRLRRAQFAGLKVAIFKPSLDKRYSETRVVSHDEKSISSTPVDNASSILLLAGDVSVVGIDEAQFFDESIVNVCNTLADNGIRIIVAGLDMDFMGKPFGPMPALLAIAEYVTKVHAICMHCGNLAQYSYRKSGGEQVVLLGEKDIYEALCRACYNKATKK
jgi:thymidine kinase